MFGLTKKELQKPSKSWEEIRLMRNEISQNLYDYVVNKTKNNYPKYIGNINMSKNVVSHIAPGDTVILNVFDFYKCSRNGWDLGVGNFVDSWNDGFTKVKPLIAVVEKLTPTYCRVDDLIDKFIDNISEAEFDRMYNEPKFAINLYEIRMDARTSEQNSVFDKYGVYQDVKVRLQYEEGEKMFTVNSHSFIKLNSEEGTYTLNTWHRMYSLKKKQIEIEAKLNSQKEKIDEEIQNIMLEIKMR